MKHSSDNIWFGGGFVSEITTTKLHKIVSYVTKKDNFKLSAFQYTQVYTKLHFKSNCAGKIFFSHL